MRLAGNYNSWLLSNKAQRVRILFDENLAVLLAHLEGS